MFSFSSVRVLQRASTPCRSLSIIKSMAATTRLLSTTRSEAVDKMHKAFNSQVTNELNASQLYLSASIWFSEQELTGMSAFALTESQEERAHALEMVEFGLKRDYPIDLEALPAPHSHWRSIEALWVDLLEAEKSNSQAIFRLADAANDCQDHALVTFLQPFHTEQVNAVANLKTIVAKVREETRTPGLIRQLDTEMGAGRKAIE